MTSKTARRPSVVAAAVALVALVVASLPSITLPLREDPPAAVAVAAMMIACVGAAVWSRSGPAVRLSAVAAALVLPLLMFGPAVWPLHFVLAAAVGLLPATVLPVYAGAQPWLRPGRWVPALPWLVLLTIVVAGAALLAWGLVVRPDVGPFLGPLQGSPVPIAIGGVLIFAMVNAALEEAVFRGVAQTDLVTLIGPVAGLLVQAVCFGMMHVNGFPAGPVGVMMATTYGLVLGVVRRESDGMLAPYLTHVAANLTIGTLAVTVL